MTKTKTKTLQTGYNIQIDNYLPHIGRELIMQEILDGLRSNPKTISSKFFYDAAGSKLFEVITELPEYYPTRTEKELISIAANRIRETLQGTDIVEFGSGDCSKISLILERVPKSLIASVGYIPVDVSKSAVLESVKQLSKRFPEVTIHGIVADFMSQLEVIPKSHKRLFCFFGSTIGNLTRKQAEDFVSDVSGIMLPGDRLLLGMDRVKDQQVLEDAYNDSQSITAEFNLNILNVVNRLGGTDFNPADFEHVAFFNSEFDRIEMHLKAKKQNVINSHHLDDSIVIRAGEMIHTENSHKFTQDHIIDFQAASGLHIDEVFTDRNEWFYLVCFRKTEGC